jgi:hypothetical protein
MAEPTATAQAVEIAKTIIDKLSEAAKAAQTTVETALPHVVKAYMYRQLGLSATFAFLLLVGLGLVYAATRFGVWDTRTEDPKWGLLPLIAGSVALLIAVIGTVATMGDTIGVLGDPLGMFILGLIGK